MTLWVWIHAAANLLMIVLDTVWWTIAMRLIKRPLWRAVASIFLAAEIVAAFVNAAGIDLGRYLSTPALAAVVLWHFFGAIALGVLALIYACQRVTRWRRKKAAAATAIAAPEAAGSVTRREFIGTCAALAPPLFTFSLTGIALGQLSDFRLRRFTLSLPTLPPQLDGMTIAHVSDIHVGEWTHGPVLRKVVQVTNHLRADLVLITGDLINYELSDLSEAISLVKQMPGRYGLWMIEGNHDLIENGTEFERRVKAAGLPLLLDDSAVTEVRGHPVQFFGLRWMDGIGRFRDRETALQLREAMKHRQPDAFPILLAHHPHAFDAAVAADLPLTLTGHTHGGQLMLDHNIGIGPALFRYWSGLYRRGNSQMIVSNGVGNMFPLRINAPAEIVQITLRRGVA